MSSDSQDVRAIRQTIRDLGVAYAAGDLDRFAGFFTDDIVAMPPGMVPIEGGNDWRKLLAGMFDRSTREEVAIETKEITVLGDWAIEWHVEAAT